MSIPRLRLSRSASSSPETRTSSLSPEDVEIDLDTLGLAVTPTNSRMLIDRPLHLDTTLLTPTNAYAEHSPALSMKIKVPKRTYSEGGDPLERMQTPVFDKNHAAMMKKTPSSTGTVLAMSGLFVCGVVLLCSGVLVLIVQVETPFVIAGCSFVGIGLAMLFVCAILQWKNIFDMNFHLTGMSRRQQIWKTMFESPSELPQMSQ